MLWCRYEKYSVDKGPAEAKSKDPFSNAYTEVLERINELTLVSICIAAVVAVYLNRGCAP